MKVRHNKGGGDDKIELQMTPMIDIVFQLLVFFIMTFKIVSQEGDFNIKMPLAAPSAGTVDELQMPPIKVRLAARSDGTLSGVYLNERSIDFKIKTNVDQIEYADLELLRFEIIAIIGDDRGPGSYQEQAEVELDCDYDLHYTYVVNAITAVSGYVNQGTGEIVKLVEKIKFAPPREPGE